MCKKQTSVSHSSTEAEIISLAAGLRMDGLPAFDLWDNVLQVLQSRQTYKKPSIKASGEGFGGPHVCDAIGEHLRHRHG